MAKTLAAKDAMKLIWSGGAVWLGGEGCVISQVNDLNAPQPYVAVTANTEELQTLEEVLMLLAANEANGGIEDAAV